MIPSLLYAPRVRPDAETDADAGRRRRIAVVGSGISGLSCAWLLAPWHDVTLYEAEDRLGGHSHTVTVPDPEGDIDVDTGFIVYNERTYPNLTALFAHLGTPTAASDMSLAISRGAGAGEFEYAGGDLRGLLAQKRNLLRPRFWRMLAGIARFYRRAPRDIAALETDLSSLGAYLDANGFGRTVQDDHLLPMAAAIWSCGPDAVRDQPAAGFIRFCVNHGLLQLTGRPVWRSVVGGSRHYVRQLADAIAARGGRILTSAPVRAVRRLPDGVAIDAVPGTACFDEVVIATHAPQALALLADATARERAVLGSLRTTRNTVVLHEDPSFMPRRRRAWSSWNVRDSQGETGPCVTYWMNRLQPLPTSRQLFVTLNPARTPRGTLRSLTCAHPVFDARALAAQRRLGTLQGRRRTWFCGAWFGAGFHEDGLQAGLAVAEALNAMRAGRSDAASGRRPWTLANPSDRLWPQDAAHDDPAHDDPSMRDAA